MYSARCKFICKSICWQNQRQVEFALLQGSTSFAIDAISGRVTTLATLGRGTYRLEIQVQWERLKCYLELLFQHKCLFTRKREEKFSRENKILPGKFAFTWRQEICVCVRLKVLACTNWPAARVRSSNTTITSIAIGVVRLLKRLTCIIRLLQTHMGVDRVRNTGQARSETHGWRGQDSET